MLYKIYYPSSLTNQSLSITSNDNDTVTTSNGTIYRNMQVQTYNFKATGSSGYTPGDIFIDNIDQGSSNLSNYVVQKDINVTVGEATYVGVYYSHSYQLNFIFPVPAGSSSDYYTTTIDYTLTSTNSVSGETKTITDTVIYTEAYNMFNVSLPSGSVYDLTLEITDPSNRFFWSTGNNIYTVTNRTITSNANFMADIRE